MCESMTDCPGPFVNLPPPVANKLPGMLSDEQVKQFFEDGYLIVKDFLKTEELVPCLEAISQMVENLAQWLYSAGKISNLHQDEGVFRRLTKLEADYPGASVLLFKQGQMPKEFLNLWSNERLLNMVEQLIGPDVAGHPVWNLRVKPPVKEPKKDKMTVPWHQDSAYFSEDSYDHMIVTTWIPLLDTNSNNGCMQVVRGGHRKGRMARHTCCVDDTWFVSLEEEDMEKTLEVDAAGDTVTCEVPFGGFLLFNNLTPHRSLPNVSDNIRWSIDLRWQSPYEKWGFYDIVPGVVMRSSTDPDVKPDWDKFLSVNRKEVWQTRHYKKVEDADPFDTTVTGPWIGRWDITHHNKHTLSFINSLKD